MIISTVLSYKHTIVLISILLYKLTFKIKNNSFISLTLDIKIQQWSSHLLFFFPVLFSLFTDF